MAFSLMTTALHAQSIWTGTASDTLWSNSSNWVGGTLPANDGTADIRFAATSSGTVVNVDAPATIGAITFGDPSTLASTVPSYTISGSDLAINGLTLSSTYRAIYNNSTASQTINNNLTVNSAGSISIASNANAGALVLNGAIVNNASVLSINPFSLGATKGIYLNGVISGSGKVQVQGNGAKNNSSVYINGVNTYTGSTELEKAVVYIGTDARLGQAGAFGTSTSDVTIGYSNITGATQSILTNGNVQVERSFGFASITDTANTITTFGSAVVGSVSTFTGRIKTTAGAAGQVANSLIVTAATNSTVYFTGANASGGLIIDRPSNATGTADYLNKIGMGKVVMQGSSNYQGVTYVNQGTLSTTVLANGGTASGIGASTSDAANLQLRGGGTLEYTGAATSTDRSFTIAANGATIAQNGTGALHFTNTGANVSADPASRTATLTSNNATVTLVNTTQVNGFDLAVGTSVSGVGIAPGAVVTWVNPTGSSFTINSTATTSGQQTLSFGGVNRTLTLSGTNANHNSIDGTLSDSALGGKLAIAKTGTGTWALAGSNTYTGATTVSAGMLLINGTLSGTGDAITVSNGAVLGGNGTISGRGITVRDGGTLSAGDANDSSVSQIGTLTLQGDLALSNASNLLFDLGAIGASDSLMITGNLTLDGILSINQQAGFGEGTYHLISYTGTLTDSTLTLNALSGGYTGSISVGGGYVDLIVVPEPHASWLMILGAAMCMVCSIRRRRSLVS